MAVDKNSTGYVYGFAVVLVGIVAALLAFLATSLKPAQTENIEDEKRKFILKAAGIMDRDADWSKEVVKAKFEEVKLKETILTYAGNDTTIKGVTPFTLDVVKVFKSTPDASKRVYPIFVVKTGDSHKYVIPMAGKGLWGPVWAYVAVDADGRSITGAVFDHKSETPGLGAEIKDGEYFWRQFDAENGLVLTNDAGEYKGISAVKGAATNKHEIDAIAGATITSVGVGNMLKESFEVYMDFMKNYK